VLWIAVGKGVVRVPDPVRRGELAIFAPGQEAVDFVAEAEAEFMLGSAVPQPYELVTGYYSVHTDAGALAKGEQRIREIETRARGAAVGGQVGVQSINCLYHGAEGSSVREDAIDNHT
jgi:hypothetical protein